MTKRIVFTWDGVAHEEGSLKVREAERIERMTGVFYTAFNPSRELGHKIAMALVCLERTCDPKEASEIVDGLGVAEFLACWSVVDDDLPEEYVDGLPLEAAAPSTAT